MMCLFSEYQSLWSQRLFDLWIARYCNIKYEYISERLKTNIGFIFGDLIVSQIYMCFAINASMMEDLKFLTRNVD